MNITIYLLQKITNLNWVLKHINTIQMIFNLYHIMLQALIESFSHIEDYKSNERKKKEYRIINIVLYFW